MITYRSVPFHQLTLEELYRLLQLRQEVFVIEQNCPYLDCDGKDLSAIMVLGENEQGLIVASTRLLPVGVSYPDYPSIGRVVNAPSVRGTGVGRSLMLYSIEQMYKNFGHQPIKIGAQAYLRAFYESLGFVFTGEAYLEDDIPHISMIKSAP